MRKNDNNNDAGITRNQFLKWSGGLIAGMTLPGLTPPSHP